MNIEIQYHRLQAKVAKMQADFKEKTKELRKENQLLKKKNSDLNNRLENALKAIEREKNSNKTWIKERNKLLKEIRDLKQDISNKDAHIANLKKACKVNDNDIWMIEDYPRVKQQLRDYSKKFNRN